MTRPSFRPRPVDINRRLPIVRSVREFVDDDPTFALRAAPPLLRHSAPEPLVNGEVRRNLEQSKVLMEALITREEKKRETMEYEVHLRRVQMKYRHEALLDGGITHSGLQVSSQGGSSDDEYADSDDTITDQFWPRFTDNKLSAISSVRLKRELELKRKLHQTAWFFRRDPEEPVMLFTGPLNRDKMEIAGIRPPPDPPIGSSSATKPPFRCQGRIGRGGRIIFDRWNPLLQVPIGQQASHFLM